MADFAPVLSATSILLLNWIMGQLYWDLNSETRVKSLNIGSTSFFDNASDTPALQLADGAGLHNFNAVTYTTLTRLVVNMKDGFALDLFFVEGMGNLIIKSNLDGLRTRDTDDLSGELLTAVTCSFAH